MKKSILFVESLSTIFHKLLGRRRFRSLSKEPENILIIKLAAMGDMLNLMPSVQEHLAQTRVGSITILTSPRTNPSIYAHSDRLRFMVLRLNIKSVLTFFELLASISKFDIVIDLDQYYRTTELLSRLGKISAGFCTERKGHSFDIKIPYSHTKHESILFNQALSRCMLACERMDSKRSVREAGSFIKECSADSRGHLAGFFNKTVKKNVFLYPGSSGNAKFRRWPVESFVIVAKQLAVDYRVYIAGGPDEISLSDYFKDIEDVFCLINKFTLPDWNFIFQNYADLVIANDGGLLHLADSARCPTIGIFGPSLSSKWGSKKACSIHFESTDQCRPCIKTALGVIPSVCRMGDLRCLKSIDPHRVVHESKLLLKDESRCF